MHDHRLDTRRPAIHDVLRGIRRSRSTAKRRVAAATTLLLRAMVATCENSLLGQRDRALLLLLLLLLLLGFAAALRRSELAALEIGDLAFVPEGLRLRIRRSKTDQESVGESHAAKDAAKKAINQHLQWADLAAARAIWDKHPGLKKLCKPTAR
jgi:integrase